MFKRVCLFLLIALLLVGCAAKKEIVATNEKYDIIRRGDSYSIRVKKNSGFSMGYNRIEGGATIDRTPEFADLASMKQAILEGDFTALEFGFATRFLEACKIDSYEAEIYNPYELYQPYVPEGVAKNSDVRWQARSYYINYRLKNHGGALCSVYIWREEEYLAQVSKFDNGFANIKELANLEGYPKYSIIEEKEESDTGKQSILYTRTSGSGYVETNFIVREKYTTPGKNLRIEYKYNDDYDGSENAVPDRINVYGTENGGYFYVQLYSLTETLDVDFISQFGITPYEGNEPPPKAIG